MKIYEETLVWMYTTAPLHESLLQKWKNQPHEKLITVLHSILKEAKLPNEHSCVATRGLQIFEHHEQHSASEGFGKITKY